MGLKKRIKVVGNVGQGHEAQNVHDPSGIAPTVREMHGKVTKILVVTGNSKKKQRLKEKKLASAIKSSNQTNPRSGGTTLVYDAYNKAVRKGKGAKTLRSNEGCSTAGNLIVSGQTNGTNMPAKSTESIGGKSVNKTSEQLTLLPYQNTTSSQRDFLANLSVLLGSEEDLKILEAHYSLRYAESLGLKELHIYYLRMSKDSSPTMTEIPSKPSSERWMNLGMTASGKCLTARISVSHKTGRGCSLSDILEGNPDQKYFLSEKQTKHIQKVVNGEAKKHQQDMVYNPETDTPNLPAGTHGSTPHLMKIYQQPLMQTTTRDVLTTDSVQ